MTKYIDVYVIAMNWELMSHCTNQVFSLVNNIDNCLTCGVDEFTLCSQTHCWVITRNWVWGVFNVHFFSIFTTFVIKLHVCWLFGCVFNLNDMPQYVCPSGVYERGVSEVAGWLLASSLYGDVVPDVNPFSNFAYYHSNVFVVIMDLIVLEDRVVGRSVFLFIFPLAFVQGSPTYHLLVCLKS